MASYLLSSIAALKLLDPATFPAADAAAIVAGYYAPGDRGGGYFRWEPSSDMPDDGGWILAPSNPAQSGRWIRFLMGSELPNIRMWGAVGDLADNPVPTDDTAAIRNALHAFENPHSVGKWCNVLVVPSGQYLISDTIYFSGEMNIVGENETYSRIYMSNTVPKDMFVTYQASNSMAGVSTYYRIGNYDNGLRVSQLTLGYTGEDYVDSTNAVLSIGRYEEDTRIEHCAFYGGGYGLRCFGIGNPGVRLHHVRFANSHIASVFIGQDYAGEEGSVAGGPVNIEEISGDNILAQWQTNASFIVFTNVFGTVRISGFKVEGAWPRGVIRWDNSLESSDFIQGANSPMCALRVENVYWNLADARTPDGLQYLLGRDLIEFGGGGQRSPSLCLQGVHISGITNLIRDNITGRNVATADGLGQASAQQAARLPIFYQSSSNAWYFTNGFSADEILSSRLIAGDTELYSFMPPAPGWYRVLRCADGSIGDNASLAGSLAVKCYPHFDDTEFHFNLNNYGVKDISWNVVRATPTNAPFRPLCQSPRVDKARAFYYFNGRILVGYIDLHVQVATNCAGSRTPITLGHSLRGDGELPDCASMQLLCPIAPCAEPPPGAVSKEFSLLEDGTGSAYFYHW